MIIICNWKMNPEKLSDGEEILNEIKNEFNSREYEHLLIAPPSLYFFSLKEKFGDFFDFGLQNVFYEEKGAFTGEISPKMAKNSGAKFVILGHSERKKFGEKLEDINKKVLTSLKIELRVILCFGENIKFKLLNEQFFRSAFRSPSGHSATSEASGERGRGLARSPRLGERGGDEGKLREKIILEWNNQLKILLKDISVNSENLYLAYEPAWAISSQGIGGASKEYLEFFLDWYKQNYKFPILYGGSVDNENIKNYLELAFDGFLIGSASLNSDEMKKIINITNQDVQ